MTKPTPTYVSEAELSEHLRIPVRTLQTWRYQGRGIPYVKFGATVRYSLQAVEKYVARQTQRVKG